MKYLINVVMALLFENFKNQASERFKGKNFTVTQELFDFNPTFFKHLLILFLIIT